MILRGLLAFALAAAPVERDPNAAAGEAAFADGRWDEASAAFAAAHRSTGDPAFLYARAQAERRADRCKLAIDLLEQFIATAPPPQGQAAATQYIAECRARLPAELPPPPPTAIIEPTPPPPSAPRPPPWRRDVLGAALVGGGGVGLVAGAVLLPLAYRAASRADTAGDDRAYGEQFAKARRLEIGGAIALSVGTALIVGGIIRWVTLARRSGRPSIARVR